MKFYYIWAKLFSFELKNTYKIDIRNMSPKNAIKMINIQKSYSVHFVLFNPHSFCLVYVGPTGSISSTLIQLYPIMSYLIHICYIIIFNPFSPPWLYLVHIGPIQSTLLTSVLFSPLHSLLFYLVDSGPIWSTMALFVPIQSLCQL